MFLELKIVILRRIIFSRFLDVMSWGFLLIGVNGAAFVRRSCNIMKHNVDESTEIRHRDER
jgi:hypothetical protein